MNLVLMGVAGCGKSTVGARLAVALGWRFIDADDFHPPASVRKMAAGEPLTDADRWPWIEALAAELRTAAAAGQSVVLACSALRRALRARLREAGAVRFVLLDGPEPLLAARLQARAGHYMPAALLGSQLAALERPTDALVVDIRPGVEQLVRRICEGLGLTARPGPTRGS